MSSYTESNYGSLNQQAPPNNNNNNATSSAASAATANPAEVAIALESKNNLAAQEAVGWAALCDQYVSRLAGLENECSESSHRSRLVEAESYERFYIYQSLCLGISGQSFRLAAHFSSLMEDVRALQNNHERLQQERTTHTASIAEYHAQQILEQRSQAEANAMSFQNRIESLRHEERDLRVRVESLRGEAEESQTHLDRRRQENLDERRHLESDLQRLQNEVQNQRYFLERLNAQVDSSKQRLRENERFLSEQQQFNENSRNNSINNNINNNSNNANSSSRSPEVTQQQRSAVSPERHGDSISTGILNVKSVRESGADESFLKFGRLPAASSAQQHVFNTTPQRGSANNNTSAATPQQQQQQQQYLTSAGQQQRQMRVVPVALSSAASNNSSTPGNRNNAVGGGALSSPSTSLIGSSSSSSSSATPPSSRSGVYIDQSNPSQWQLRLMKLQGELKSLKTDLGVNSPYQGGRAAASSGSGQSPIPQN